MRTKWLIKEAPNLSEVQQLRSEIKLEETIAYMLVQRGIKTQEAAYAFFNSTLKQLHDPFLMKDMEKAVQRVQKALDENEKILIYGDYDVDGTTAVALVYSILSKHTDQIAYYIPDRYIEGYGVSEKGIHAAHEGGFTLLITLDCGIKANDKIDLAKSFGIDTIVCDHHTPGEVLPDAIVLDPKRTDCDYPYKELSGCGVGFKLMQALTTVNNWEEKILFSNLDLLAISIGADIVHVTGENRLLAQFGLKQINQATYQRMGVNEMLRLAKKERPLTLEDVVFTIAPRINAAGRLDDAKTAVKLLISNELEEVKRIAQGIHVLNDERRELDKEITTEALAMIAEDATFKDKHTTVVYKDDWHKGVVGIVASRLIEKHYRPTIVLTSTDNGESWTGSARSIKDIDIYEVLEKCSSTIEQFGGHIMAAGMTIKNENLQAFIDKFEEEVRKLCNSETLIPEQIVEKELPFNQLFTMAESVHETPRLMRVLKQFEPHGPENMKPLFMATNVFSTETRLLKGEHLKMKVSQPDFERQSIDAIFFNAAEYLEIVEDGPFEMVYTLDENQFRGKTTPQIMVKDIRKML